MTDKGAEFIIAATYGDIAQLGERLNGIQEVVGSIPIISTKSMKQGKPPCFFCLKKHIPPITDFRINVALRFFLIDLYRIKKFHWKYLFSNCIKWYSQVVIIDTKI